MKTPPKYQYHKDVREFVKDKRKIGLFEFYGAGKTWQSLQWLEDLSTLGPVFPCLVLCPNNLMTQWGDQIKQHSDFTSIVVDGSLRERREKLLGDANFFIVSYGALKSGLRSDLNILSTRCWTIIADESTYLKSAKTTRFKLCMRYFSGIPNRAILSGKPITEKPQDLWSQMLFLDDGKRLGKSFFGFMHDFLPASNIMPDHYVDDASIKKITDAIKDICVYVPRSVVADQLPLRIEIPVYFKMPKEVRKKYDELRETFSIEFKSIDDAEKTVFFETQWAIVKSQKLHQLCQGFMYVNDVDEDGGVKREAHSFATEKFDWLVDSVPEILTEGPLIIWAKHRHTVEQICYHLSELGIPHGYFMGGGEDAKAGIKQFIEGEVDCVVLSIQAAFAGFNLQRAKSAIFFSKGYSGDQNDNAIHRNYRLGSEIHDKIIAYELLVEDSIDTVVRDALAGKMDVSKAILDHLTLS